jgi:hypothetical protein
MTEGLDNFLGLVIFFSPCVAAFALVTFSPLRQLRQPVRLFVIGLANGAIAAFLSVLGMLRGMISSRLLLFIVGVSIVIGAFQPSGFIRIDQSKEKRRTRKEK